MTVTIEIDEALERRLQALVDRTGESRADLLRNIVQNGIEDVEGYFSAAAIVERLRRGEERTYPLEEVVRELGLDH